MFAALNISKRIGLCFVRIEKSTMKSTNKHVNICVVTLNYSIVFVEAKFIIIIFDTIK